jgi:hypothetical protein
MLPSLPVNACFASADPADNDVDACRLAECNSLKSPCRDPQMAGDGSW